MTGKHNPAVEATIRLLTERWPLAFSVFEGRRRPLKIGIHLDILAALDGTVTPDALSLALKVYVSNKVYRSRLVTGAVRIGLDGAPAGVVTEKEAAMPPKMAAPAKTPPASPPPPKRISLTDLRAAAASRKAAVAL